MAQGRTYSKTAKAAAAATAPTQGVEKDAKAGRIKKLSVTKNARVKKGLSVVNFSGIFHSSPSARVDLIRTGVSADDVKRLQRELDMPQQTFLASVNLSTATLNRKVSQRESLSPQDSERVIGVAKLVGQVQAMVEHSGDPTDFNAAKWLAIWLQQPVPALGGVRPIDYMDTMEGQGMVSDILARMQSGAYS
jgi:putative toxin-antitoxin system antitoxin component (TIGR02293 family)